MIRRTWAQTAIAGILLGGLLLAQPGCKTTARASSKAVTGSAKVTGKVAVAAVKTSGQVAIITAKTTGKIATQGVKAAASIAKGPLVTLKDTTTGIVRQIPWTEGLKLYTASKSVEFNTYLKAFTIFREGAREVIRTDWPKIKAGAPEPVLWPGDVVEITALR
jgi:hypothetical protein